MESLLAWVKENVSPTASLEENPLWDGFRQVDGSWYESIPSSLHYDKQKVKHSSVAFDLCCGSLDLHNVHSVNERVEFDGQVFWLSKAFIFNAKDYHIENGEMNSWAESQKMDVKVLPKELSNHPSRTFCILQPLNVFNFFSTFRAWLILNGYDLLYDRKKRHLIDGGKDFFWDILWCHDDFFANLGTRKDDLRNLLKFYSSEEIETDEGEFIFICPDAFERELKHLWAMYLWARLRKKMIQWGKYGSVFVSICKEVQARPGNSDFQSARRSFESMALYL